MRRKPYLSPKAIAKRKEWARDNMKRDWPDVIFTDECALELGGLIARRPRATRCVGEAYAPPTHPTNLPFWSTEPDGLGID